MAELIFKEESYKLIGACFEVHKALGFGFKEVVYQDALEVEFKRQKIPFCREHPFTIYYKEQRLKHQFIADFLAYEKIIIELKAAGYIGVPYIKQTMNYLKASGLKLGIVVNFGSPSLEFQRIVF
ncbi:GxxExxY protein [Desertivirga arenae]|uniref:GxxExxY protein n=1 Tax=Desertivirga arenae TaxID=2810309 RepID=UPI001A976440|nr:GxxExxY protein [Pedobacter sp. SYSU D00823]